jgi:hypothetical protein
MRVVFHPEFPKEIKAFELQYREVSERLGLRFRREVDEAIAKIKDQPGAAGHFVNTGSKIVKELRRRNLVSFPFFVLYGIHEELLVFRSLIPNSSDPLTWLRRLGQ